MSAVEFGGEVDYRMMPAEIGLETAFELNSYSYDILGGRYQFSYTDFMPSVMYYRVIEGKGYQFKFGGGIGPRFLSVGEIKPPLSSEVSYTATGWGLVIRVDAATQVAAQAYAYIGGDIRYNSIPDPENNGKPLQAITNPNGIKFSSLGVGVKLGILFIL